MHWLTGGFENLQLDIVGFLAILGEASVLANAQVSALSWFFLLPRLVPAPQALIRTTRPERLEPATGKVFGVYSGSVSHDVQYMAHMLHDGGSLPDYAVKCVKITEVENKEVQAKTWGPLSLLSMLGCSMSIALLVVSVVKGDGMALLATLLLSCLSTLVGIGSRWKIEFKERSAKREIPDSDVVIKYPQGSFLVVKCKKENIARQLYIHPPECNYQVGTTAYRIISLVGTMMLMFGVICLGNATLILQILYAGAYLILNAAYWAVAALPQQWHWDLTHFNEELVHYEGEYDAKGNLVTNTFTSALWKAIALSQSVQWVHNGQVAPLGDGWANWLSEAKREVEGVRIQSKPEPDVEKDEKHDNYMVLPKWNAEDALTAALDRHRRQPPISVARTA